MNCISGRSFTDHRRGFIRMLKCFSNYLFFNIYYLRSFSVTVIVTDDLKDTGESERLDSWCM